MGDKPNQIQFFMPWREIFYNFEEKNIRIDRQKYEFIKGRTFHLIKVPLCKSLHVCLSAQYALERVEWVVLV